MGNKRDSTSERQVSTEEAKALAGSLGCEFFEASAKTSANVEAVFKSVIRQIRISRGQGVGGQGSGGGGGGGHAGGGGGGGGGGRGKKRKKCVIL